MVFKYVLILSLLKLATISHSFFLTEAFRGLTLTEEFDPLSRKAAASLTNSCLELTYQQSRALNFDSPADDLYIHLNRRHFRQALFFNPGLDYFPALYFAFSYYDDQKYIHSGESMILDFYHPPFKGEAGVLWHKGMQLYLNFKYFAYNKKIFPNKVMFGGAYYGKFLGLGFKLTPYENSPYYVEQEPYRYYTYLVRGNFFFNGELILPYIRIFAEGGSKWFDESALKQDYIQPGGTAGSIRTGLDIRIEKPGLHFRGVYFNSHTGMEPNSFGLYSSRVGLLTNDYLFFRADIPFRLNGLELEAGLARERFKLVASYEYARYYGSNTVFYRPLESISAYTLMHNDLKLDLHNWSSAILSRYCDLELGTFHLINRTRFLPYYKYIWFLVLMDEYYKNPVSLNKVTGFSLDLRLKYRVRNLDLYVDFFTVLPFYFKDFPPDPTTGGGSQPAPVRKQADRVELPFNLELGTRINF